MNKLNTYIIYYDTPDGGNGYEVQGVETLRAAVK